MNTFFLCFILALFFCFAGLASCTELRFYAEIVHGLVAEGLNEKAKEVVLANGLSYSDMTSLPVSPAHADFYNLVFPVTTAEWTEFTVTSPLARQMEATTVPRLQNLWANLKAEETSSTVLPFSISKQNWNQLWWLSILR